MIIRSVALLACSALFAVTQAGEIYKWKDANGKIHYGDSALEARGDAKPLDLKNSALSEAQRQEVEARRAKEKAVSPNNTAPAATAPPSAPVAASGKESACEEAWRKYRESDACFAPYRLVNGGIKAEAFQHCVEVKQPPPCQ